ncbi:MAG: hypothetical protein AAB368_10515 [bacterium]
MSFSIAEVRILLSTLSDTQLIVGVAVSITAAAILTRLIAARAWPDFNWFAWMALALLGSYGGFDLIRFALHDFPDVKVVMTPLRGVWLATTGLALLTYSIKRLWDTVFAE